ncbi:MAG: glycosyltransferase family 39 protein [Myxococcales bacterium]|nr:glycosyltransferase family 39 protein [Myxococcales bacterium]
MAAIRGSTLTRLQIASLVALLLICSAALLHEVYWSDDASFLTRGNGANWIGYPIVPSSDAIPVLRENAPATTFTRRFEVDQGFGPAMLTARGLRSLELKLNGTRLFWDEPLDSWQDTLAVDVTEQLRSGANEIRVQVRNPSGPALLQLAIRGKGIEVETDTRWEVSAQGIAVAQAAPARDNQLFADSLIMPRPGEVFGRHALVLGILFLLFAGVSTAARNRSVDANFAWLPKAVLGGVTCYWIAVFVLKISQLPVMMGFDIPAHLQYLDYLIENRSLPDATQGWSTYHPPLFYLLTAALVLAGDVTRESATGQVVYRIVCFGSGLTTVWVAYFCARRFFDNDPVKTALAVGFAGLLPMNLYVSAYVSNESLLVAWSSFATLLALNALLAEKTSTRQWLAVGGALGFAIATKFSGLILVPVFAAVIGSKIGLLDGDDRTTAARRGGAAFAGILAATALVGGWFYLRNYLAYGEWVIWNVNLPGTSSWWEYPGFHTASYYSSFGESLRHPFFAGFYSFWDGIYSTFWGDGLLAGMVHVDTRHPYWNYDFMTLGYWTALPLSFLLAIGSGRLLERAFRADSLHARIAASFMFVVMFVLLFSLFIVTFRVPYYAQAKAFYVLAAILPLSIAAASGISVVDRALQSPRMAPLRVIFHGWLGTAVAVIVWTYLG